MKTPKWMLLVSALAVTSCGTEPPKDDTQDDNNATVQNNDSVGENNDSVGENNLVDENNAPVDENNAPVDENNDPVPQNNDPTQDPVKVDCVSDLVTNGGNYYALSALVAEAGTVVEMVQYYAATPTSDPVEAVIWTETVDAQFTALQFAFEVEEVYLDVTRESEDGMYRGTMSGETQFGDEVTVTCWPEDFEITANYDPATGNCLDAAGNEAMNDLPFMYAARTGFGQCTRFEGTLNQEALGYPVFDFIDLRGSDFNEAALSFAELRRVQFEGADLRQFDFGYATIAGTIDEFTQLPELAECDVPDGASEFECTR